MKYQPPFVYGATPGAPGIHNASVDASYVNGDPALGQEGSYCPVEAWEHPQREIVAAIVAAGLTPDHAVLTQLRQAIARSASGGTWFGCTGSANAYTLAATASFDVPSSPFSGQLVRLQPNHTNTGAATATFAGVTKAIRTWDDVALTGGEIVSGRHADAVYAAGANGGAGALLLLPWSVPFSVQARAYTPPLLNGSFSFSGASNVITNISGIAADLNTLVDSTFSSGGLFTAGAKDAGVWLFAMRAGTGNGGDEIFAEMNSAAFANFGASSVETPNGGPLANAFGILRLNAGQTVQFRARQINGGASSRTITGTYSGTRIGA